MSDATRDAALAVIADVTRKTAWFPIVVFGIHIVAALGFDAYDKFPPLDIPMHVIGGVAIAYFISGTIVAAERHDFIPSIGTFIHLTLILALTTSATVFWELAEWTTDHTIGTHAQQGLDDTLLDMLCGVIGGVVFVCARAIRNRRT